MDFRETLSAQLPPSRPDEPARLRQDILDELNDHLVCSYHREILRGLDSSVARHRVLAQFGDPAAVACRLWLDAMRGKIMIQRVVIGTSVFVAAACVALVAIFWQQALHAQRLAALQAVDAQAREREMLDRLKEMTEAIKHPRSPDWNPVRFSFTERAADGPPARGVSVVLYKVGDQSTKVNRQSNEAGVADFGLLNPGRYSFQLDRMLADGEITASGELDVQPGESVDKHIVCPKLAAQQASVRVGCKWPDDLASASLVLYLPLRHRYLETSPGIEWVSTVPGRFFQSHTILLGPSSSVSTYKRHDAGNSKGTVPHARVDSQAGLSAQVRPEEFDIAEADLERKPAGSLVDLDTGTYRLFGLLVLRPLPVVEPGRQRFERLVGATDPAYLAPGRGGVNGSMRSRAQQKTETQGKRGGIHFSIVLPSEFWQRMDNDLVARAGQSNEWTIPLPEELIQAVRDALKADKTPRNEPAVEGEAIKGTG
jgi:hypothetical protein